MASDWVHDIFHSYIDCPYVDSSTQFSNISTRDDNNLHSLFSLQCLWWTCKDGSSLVVGDMSHEVVNGPWSVTKVTVKVYIRQAGGIYVSNDTVLFEVFNIVTNSFDKIFK